MWELDTRTNKLVWDDAMFEIYGVNPKSFSEAYEAWTAALHPQDYEISIQRVEEALRPGGRPFDIEFRIDHPTAGERILRGIARVTRDPSGAPIRMTGVNFDVTADRLASKALEEAALFIQTLIDNVIDGIITIDATGKLQTYNKSAESIFGYTSEEILGHSVAALMPECADGHHEDFLSDFVAADGSGETIVGREVEGRRKSGQAFPLELAVSEIQFKGQNIFVAIVRDITERKRIEQMKAAFISTVSHELRTPLTSISGALRLIMGGVSGEVSKQAHSLLSMALNNSERLTLLINDLLDMEKMTAGKMTFDMVVHPIAPLIDQAIASNQGYAATHGVQLAVEKPVPDAKIRIDANRLMQVLANYLSNAIKFSPKGGNVTVKAEERGSSVRISVIDCGSGIPEKFHDRIFKKFSQVESSDNRSRGGTGLGLAITKELTERMGGLVGFASSAGEGSTFWCEFSVVPTDADQADPESPSETSPVDFG